jgi:hypothetical protein
MSRASQGGFRYDFAVYDSQGRLSAVVEAKRRFGTDPSWAREWHASTVNRMNRPVEASVVLFAADRVYVWRSGADESTNPDWTFEAGSLLAPYVTRLKIPINEAAPHIFEEIVGLWLQDVVQGELPDGSNLEGTEDLLDALRGGEVVQRVAA